MQRNGSVFSNGAFTGGDADYADMLAVADKASNYAPDDVLVMVSDAQLGLSQEPNSSAVVGAYSTDPAMIGDPLGIWEQEDMERIDREMMGTPANDRVLVAMAGMVTVTAENGRIVPGDLLTTSSTPGHAMKAQPLHIDGASIYQQGTILGKAMTTLDGDEGVIEMLVMMQ